MRDGHPTLDEAKTAASLLSNHQKLRSRELLAVLAAFALVGVLAGCGDSTLQQKGVGQIEDDANNTGIDVRNNGGPSDRPPADGCCIMVPSGGETHLSVPSLNTVHVGVLLYDRSTGAPVAGDLIEFELLDTSGGVALTERSSTTDPNGLGKTGFVAGETLADYVVRATHPGANSVEFFITVEDQPTGDLHVTYVNAGASVYEVSPIETMVFPGATYDCQDFRPLSQLPDATFTDEVRDADGESEFRGLSIEGTWTIVALGKGEFGQLAAVGCVDEVFMREEATTNIEVVLTLLPLNPVGRYRNVSYWDFTEALQDTGQVGSILLQIFDAFEDPGQFLVDSVIDLVRQFVGGIIAGAVDLFLDVTGLDDRIADAINGFIANNPFLSQLQQAGLDLRDMVTHLEVISTLTIGKIGADYEVFGTDDWLGIAVYWRWDCDANSPPDCGRTEIAIDANSSLELVYGEWTGRVTAYNQLEIYPHTVNLHYGRLIVFLLNEYILPTLTDGQAHSLMDAILYWVNCGGLATSITGSDGEICAVGLCVEDDDITNICESVISTVFGVGELLLSNLEVESVLELSGRAKLIEMDGDLLVDEIVDGEYDGTINIQSTRSPFTATFDATRIPREGVDGE